MNEKELLIELKRPFPVKKVHWRIGSKNEETKQGLVFAYIDARDVMQRLDEVVPFRWQDRYSHAGSGIFICDIGIWVDPMSQWLWRANGAGETAFEAEKGGMSDAFKRAAVMWGIGRYLYKIPTLWTGINKKGSTWVINAPPVLPEWATPEGYDRLVNRKRPITEKVEKGYFDLLKHDDALAFYSFDYQLADIQKEDIFKNCPKGTKTLRKHEVEVMLSKGRNIMLEIAADLEIALENDDKAGVNEIVNEVDETILNLIKNNLSPEGNLRLSNHQ